MTRWNEFYLTDTRIPSVPPSQLVLQASRIFSRFGCQNILELGCGAGRDLEPLLEAGMDVVGLDISAPAFLSTIIPTWDALEVITITFGLAFTARMNE